MTTHTQEILDSLTNEYFGYAYYRAQFGAFTLVETQIADPYDNDGWECADWYLLDADCCETYLANCDGYSGVDLKIDLEDLTELVGSEDVAEEIIESITPYQLTGDLIAAARFDSMEKAMEDYQGECQVWVEYNYYAGTINAPTDELATDDDGDEIIFDDYQQAEAWIDDQCSEIYHTSHGEAGRPSYIIVKTR